MTATCGLDNLTRMWRNVEVADLNEGCLAYGRYHDVMVRLAKHYEFDLERVVAANTATSPNNDYVGNLRSTVSVLQAVQNNWPCDGTVVSTYGHCGRRAYAYASCETSFVRTVRGIQLCQAG